MNEPRMATVAGSGVVGPLLPIQPELVSTLPTIGMLITCAALNQVPLPPCGELRKLKSAASNPAMPVMRNTTDSPAVKRPSSLLAFWKLILISYLPPPPTPLLESLPTLTPVTPTLPEPPLVFTMLSCEESRVV